MLASEVYMNRKTFLKNLDEAKITYTFEKRITKIMWRSRLNAFELKQELCHCSGRFTGSERTGHSSISRSKLVEIEYIIIGNEAYRMKRNERSKLVNRDYNALLSIILGHMGVKR